jgi:hypothetical protein
VAARAAVHDGGPLVVEAVVGRRRVGQHRRTVAGSRREVRLRPRRRERRRVDRHLVQRAGERVPAPVAARPARGVAGAQRVEVRRVVHPAERRGAGHELAVDVQAVGAVRVGRHRVVRAAVVVGAGRGVGGGGPMPARWPTRSAASRRCRRRSCRHGSWRCSPCKATARSRPSTRPCRSLLWSPTSRRHRGDSTNRTVTRVAPRRATRGWAVYD